MGLPPTKAFPTFWDTEGDKPSGQIRNNGSDIMQILETKTLLQKKGLWKAEGWGLYDKGQTKQSTQGQYINLTMVDKDTQPWII